MQRITVDTLSGPLEGRSKEDTFLFAGVPYAAPPVDDLRFKAPRPHATWSEPRQAFKFGPAAPQVATGGMTDAQPVRSSEDCLTLNIATPACDGGKRAVLFWIHGGGYRTGQGSIPWYNGAAFAKNGDIVTVSINYRLGALGFADLTHFGADFKTSNVNGTLDQIAALTWVKDNIARFGGDPAKITIAGESAGGFSVATLLGCDSANRLFQRAIPQSGAAHHTLPKDAAEQTTERFLSDLGINNAVGVLAASTEQILEAQTRTLASLETGAGVTNKLGTPVSPFYPAHGTELLPQASIDAIASGSGSDVAVLTGTNKDETTLWGYGEVDAAKLDRIADAYGASATIDAYRATNQEASPEDILIALTTDHMFRIPAIRLAEARQSHSAETWMYLFNWQSRAFEGRLKATHALEIPFAFDNLSRAGVDAFIGPGERPQHVAQVMHQAWIDFVNEGDPGWAAYNSVERATMVFDDESAVQNDPAGAERAAWDGIR
jgi:para-nitrobenzyl esterase